MPRTTKPSASKKPRNDGNVRLQVVVPIDTLEWVREQAAAESMPISMWLRRLIERERKHGWRRPDPTVGDS